MATLLDDIQRSGLSSADIKKLGLTELTSSQVKALTGHEVAAYKIPYFTSSGEVTEFYRLRFLENIIPFGDKKPIRYWQPQQTLPRIYLAPYIKWSTVCAAKDTLYITEGEKKAAVACKHGMPCIGLGGVWSWRSKKNDVDILEDFQEFDFTNRSVQIIFDSDANTNPDIQYALVMLARALIKRGARPSTVALPSKNGKVGLDDYLLKYTIDDLLSLPAQPLVGRLASELWDFNGELAYIEESAATLVLKTGQLLNKPVLTGMAFAHRNVVVFNEDKAKEVNVATEWLKWPHRRTHNKLVYEPGQPSVSECNYNLWKGWGCAPVKGDVGPFLDLLNYIFESDPRQRKWFLQWCAYPLQHPGTKMYCAVVLMSLFHGVGKSLLGMTLGKIYGENFSLVSQEDMESPFNEWAINKQFVLGDEITGTDKRKEADKIKSMITRDQIAVNVKYQPRYVVADCINYLFTTNHIDAFFIEDNDRRYFVHEIEGAPLDDSFYKNYNTWLHGSGSSALFHYLLGIDISKFNPKAKAPMTNAKYAMAEASKSDLDLWVKSIREDADNLRIDNKIIQRDLWSIEELLSLYDFDGKKKTTRIALGKALSRAGFRALPVTTTCHGSKRLWALRNQNKWRTSTHAQRQKHYDLAHKGAVENQPSKM